MDRYDELLLKARVEMSPYHSVRKAPSHHDLFSSVWEGIVKQQLENQRQADLYQQMQEHSQQRRAEQAQQPKGGFFSNLRQGFKDRRAARQQPQQGSATLDPSRFPNMARLLGHQQQAPTPEPTQETAGSQAPPSMDLGRANEILVGRSGRNPPSITEGFQPAMSPQQAMEVLGRPRGDAGSQTPPSLSPQPTQPEEPTPPQENTPPPTEQGTQLPQGVAGLLETKKPLGLPAPGETNPGQASSAPKPRLGFEEINQRSPEKKATQHPAEQRTATGRPSRGKDAVAARQQRVKDYSGGDSQAADSKLADAQAMFRNVQNRKAQREGRELPFEEQSTDPSTKAGQANAAFNDVQQAKRAREGGKASVESAQERQKKRAANRPPPQKGGDDILNALLSNPFEDANTLHSFIPAVSTQEEVPLPTPEMMKASSPMMSQFRPDDDLSLLPKGMLQDTGMLKEADTDFSLLPRGWAEGDGA